MIQRIQSLYLLLTSVLSIIFLKCGFLEFFNRSSSDITFNFKGIWISGEIADPAPGLSQIPLSALIILIALIALAAIFLYRKRKIQMKLTVTLIISELILILLLSYYAFSILSNYQAKIVPTFSLIIPLLCLILSILAHRAIRNDENIIRSYDRLR